jgi:uncharacterized membrane protein YjgN (DUF898 family)
VGCGKAFVLWPLLPSAGAVVIWVLYAFGVKTISSAVMIVLSSVLLFLLLLFFLLSTIPVPWHRQTHYLADNSRYGAAGFKNHSTHRDFFKMFGVLLGILFLFALVMSLVAAIIFFGIGRGLPAKESSALLTVSGAVAYLILISILTALYKVRITNLRVGKTALGPHRLVSSYTFWSYLGLVITNTLAVMLTLSLFYPFAKVRTARYAAEHTAIMISGDLDGFVAERQAEVSALGSEAGDFLDIDIGF